MTLLYEFLRISQNLRKVQPLSVHACLLYSLDFLRILKRILQNSKKN